MNAPVPGLNFIGLGPPLPNPVLGMCDYRQYEGSENMKVDAR